MHSWRYACVRFRVEGFSVPFLGKIWEKIDNVELLWLMHDYEVITFRELDACARARDVNCEDFQWLGWFLYEFSIKKAWLVPPYEALGDKQKSDCDQRCKIDAKDRVSSIENSLKDSMSLRFAEMAYERYLASGTLLHSISSLSGQHSFTES